MPTYFLFHSSVSFCSWLFLPFMCSSTLISSLGCCCAELKESSSPASARMTSSPSSHPCPETSLHLLALNGCHGHIQPGLGGANLDLLLPMANTFPSSKYGDPQNIASQGELELCITLIYPFILLLTQGEVSFIHGGIVHVPENTEHLLSSVSCRPGYS